MRLGDKIPVPELSAVQAARVQRRVMAAVGGLEVRQGWFGSRLRIGVAVAAVAAVAVGLAVIPSAVDSRGAIAAGHRPVVTELESLDAEVTARLGDAVVTLAPRSRASLIVGAGGIDIALERGRVDCEVDPIPGRRPLSVGAAGVEVVVVGTVFAVDRGAGDDVRVEVDRGKVEVRAGGSSVLVEAGRAWTAADGVVSLVAKVDTELVLDDDKDGGDGAADDGNGGERSQASGDGRDARDSDRSGARSGAKGRDHATPGSTRDRRDADRQKDSGDKAAGKRRPPRYKPPAGDATLLEAMALEAKDPRAAIRKYTAIAAESRGRIASFALYSKAYVEHFRLGQRAAAVDTLDLFERRFPRAREAQSALWLRVLGLCDLGRVGECRAAAFSYIRRFPDGVFVDAASVIANR